MTMSFGRRAWLSVIALVLVLVTLGPVAAAAPAVSAAYVTGRLLAPCCWTQTLDIHESELSTTLRNEIDARVRRGESATQIEDDMASRYGERIRAVPRGEEPRAKVALVSALVVLLGLGAMGATLARWLRRGREPVVARTRGTSDADRRAEASYDARLDAELERLDEPT